MPARCEPIRSETGNSALEDLRYRRLSRLKRHAMVHIQAGRADITRRRWRSAVGQAAGVEGYPVEIRRLRPRPGRGDSRCAGAGAGRRDRVRRPARREWPVRSSWGGDRVMRREGGRNRTEPSKRPGTAPGAWIALIRPGTPARLRLRPAITERRVTLPPMRDGAHRSTRLHRLDARLTARRQDRPQCCRAPRAQSGPTVLGVGPAGRAITCRRRSDR